jgi:hypothetical protein
MVSRGTPECALMMFDRPTVGHGVPVRVDTGVVEAAGRSSPESPQAARKSRAQARDSSNRIVA